MLSKCVARDDVPGIVYVGQSPDHQVASLVLTLTFRSPLSLFFVVILFVFLSVSLEFS